MEPIWRQIILSTSATITGRVRTRSRRPGWWKCATWASVVGSWVEAR